MGVRYGAVPTTVNPNSADSASSHAERAYRILRDLILDLRLPPGEPVREDVLMREFDLGRTPFREAVKRLESEALIAIFPRRGTFVTEVNITDHALIADVRKRLEGHAARRAAENATTEERAELRNLGRAVARMARDQKSTMNLDTRVHRTIHHCTHNPYLERTLDQYYNLALRIWALFFDRLPDVTGHVAEHKALLDAVIAGRADDADRLAVDHVDRFERAIRALL